MSEDCLYCILDSNNTTNIIKPNKDKVSANEMLMAFLSLNDTTILAKIGEQLAHNPETAG